MTSVAGALPGSQDMEATRSRSAAGGAIPVLLGTGLTMDFPSVRALDDVDFGLQAGEVRALLGKNGAGKSTLVRILSGALQPDSGQILINGQEVRLGGPAAARRAGIATVYQEMSLVPDMTVADNIFMGRWLTTGPRRLGITHSRVMARAAEELLARLDVRLDPAATVRDLDVAMQQVVEIAKALSLDARVLILDEPTSSLTEHEVDSLLAVVRALARQGVAVVYVSHRMREIPQVADSVTVLRDGRVIATRPASALATSEVVEMMTGSTTPFSAPARSSRDSMPAPPILSVRDLILPGRLDGIDLDIWSGEIVGVAGLLGSGRSELLRTIYGLHPEATGRVELNGASLLGSSPKAILQAGIGFTPEDRRREGFVSGMSVVDNLVLSAADSIASFGVVNSGKAAALAQSSVTRLDIRISSLGQAVSSLSGGNQQKVVVGKCLNAGVRLLLLDEPTRGVDIEGKSQLYSLLRSLADEGLAAVVVCSEIEELFLLCDRILVLNHGRLVGDLRLPEGSLSEVMTLAMEDRAL